LVSLEDVELTVNGCLKPDHLISQLPVAEFVPLVQLLQLLHCVNWLEKLCFDSVGFMTVTASVVFKIL